MTDRRVSTLRIALIMVPLVAVVVALLTLPRVVGLPAPIPRFDEMVALPTPTTEPSQLARPDSANRGSPIDFVFVLPFQKPAVYVSPGTLASGRDGASLIGAMKQGLDHYRADRYAEAEEDLTPLRATYPRAIEVPFFIGVSRMLRGDMTEALAPLEDAAALADGTTGFEVEIAWYRAVALERAFRPADARRHLLTLCRGSSTYKRDACRGATTLGTTR